MQLMAFHFETSYRQLPSDFYSLVDPSPVSDGNLLLLNHDLCRDLDLDPEVLQSKEMVEALVGNRLLPNSQPLAQAYCGHQFGHFVRLGDGRAHLLGEHLTKNGRRFDIQLKGSGPTPYSRRGDGRAALGPMLREYLISEAMASLGLPTTRSLAVLTTGEMVYRETPLAGAILVRVAASHLRVGTFQWAANQKSQAYLEALLEYTVQRHDPHLRQLPRPEMALGLLQSVQSRQASLVAKWLLLGFVHGVMNTDNMSLCGETIDYGPCAFLDEYDPEKVFSSIDHQGRYAFANQGPIAQWNLTRLAEALLAMIDSKQEIAVQKVSEILNRFPEELSNHYNAGLARKFGLDTGQTESAQPLLQSFFDLMAKYKADYTLSFYQLSVGDRSSTFWREPEVVKWWENWSNLGSQDPEAQKAKYEIMKQANPWLIPRNHRVEEAIQAAYNGDLKPTLRLLEALKRPYEFLASHQDLQEPPTDQQRVRATFCGT